MTDIIDSGPVFVDVASGTQYPISELLSLATPQNESTDCDFIQTKQETKEFDTSQDDLLMLEERTTQTSFPEIPMNLEPRKGRYYCPECPSSFQQKQKLINHVRLIHRKQKRHQCSMCEYSTHHKAVFDEHVRVHNGIKPFKCSYCPYKSASKRNARKHEQRHRSDNPLRCKQCDFIARNTLNLTRHMQSHLEAQELETNVKKRCPNCAFTYKNLTEFKRHRKNRKRCKKCKVIACTKGILFHHMKNEHGIKPSKQTKFTCSICKWQGDVMLKILLHLIHHPNQKVDEKSIDIHILKDHGIME